MSARYRVNLKGYNKRDFYIGNGKHVTLEDGTLLDAGHKFVSLYPTYVVKEEAEMEETDVGEQQLLNEAPIGDAAVLIENEDITDEDSTKIDETENTPEESTEEIVEEETEVEFESFFLGEDPIEDITDEDSTKIDETETAVDIESFTDKSELEAYAREKFEIELDKRKSLANMKLTFHEEMAKRG